MSLRRPTVALLLLTFQYKPFMWRRSDVRLWHYCYLLFNISPLCGVALTPDYGIVNLFLPFEALLQTPDRFSVISLGFREDYRLTSFLFIMQSNFIIWVRITNLLMCIMFAFVISYVQTVLRVLSKYSPGLLIWPDVDEGDLMDEEFDSESDA